MMPSVTIHTLGGRSITNIIVVPTATNNIPKILSFFILILKILFLHPITTPHVHYKYKNRTMKNNTINDTSITYQNCKGTNSITIIVPANPRITPRIFRAKRLLRNMTITP